MLLLVIGLVAAVYLVGQQTNLFSKAYSPGSSKYPLSNPISNPITPTPTPAPFVCSACGADINRDGNVNISDFSKLSSCFNQQAVGNCAVADINGSGTVDMTDFSCLKSQYGKKCIAPTPTVSPSAKRVFVTSTTYNGNLGGLSGADAKCQTRANAANLGGTWKAWLSTGQPWQTAASRVPHTSSGYILLNGTVVANSWDDLAGTASSQWGPLSSPININENRQAVTSSVEVWTNTWATGSTYDTTDNLTCGNWTSNSTSYTGVIGSTTSTSYFWTANLDYPGQKLKCNSIARLYCFEQ